MERQDRGAAGLRIKWELHHAILYHQAGLKTSRGRKDVEHRRLVPIYLSVVK